MKKKLILSYISVVCTVAVLFMSVFAYFSLNNSLAWFSDNKTVNTSGMSMNMIDINNKIANVSVYEIKEVELMDVTDENGNKTGEVKNIFHFSFDQTVGEVKLPRLSVIEPKRQLLIMVELTEAYPFNITARSDVKKYITKNDDGSDKTSFFKDVDKSASSVMRFRATTVCTETEGEDGTKYHTIAEENLGTGAEGAMKTGASFATISNGAPGDFRPNIDVYSTATATKMVYVVVDYYEESAEYVRDFVSAKTYPTETDIQTGIDDIVFACDFKLYLTCVRTN